MPRKCEGPWFESTTAHQMKKQEQLGMNPSTASNRLVKDILFKLITDAGHVCFQCGKPMLRSNFSIEHKTPWIDSNDPVGLYFDLNNIAFSHLKCNVEAARPKQPPACGTASRYSKGCRCDKCRVAHAEQAKRSYTPEMRSAKYRTTGQ